MTNRMDINDSVAKSRLRFHRKAAQFSFVDNTLRSDAEVRSHAGFGSDSFFESATPCRIDHTPNVEYNRSDRLGCRQRPGDDVKERTWLSWSSGLTASPSATSCWKTCAGTERTGWPTPGSGPCPRSGARRRQSYPGTWCAAACAPSSPASIRGTSPGPGRAGLGRVAPGAAAGRCRSLRRERRVSHVRLRRRYVQGGGERVGGRDGISR
jgi:hypothetical protein